MSFQNHGFETIGTPTTIASQYAFGPDSAGLVVGPAGLAYDSRHDTLYVASEDDNQIFAVADASSVSSSSGKGTLIFSDDTHLHGPLGLMIAPNGNLVTANADPAAHVDPNQPSELVEFTIGGTFVRQFSIDPKLCDEPRVDPLLTVVYATKSSTGAVTQAIAGPFDLGRPQGCPKSASNGKWRIPPQKEESPL